MSQTSWVAEVQVHPLHLHLAVLPSGASLQNFREDFSPLPLSTRNVILSTSESHKLPSPSTYCATELWVSVPDALSQSCLKSCVKKALIDVL